jgi:HTH-type transcriptional regulator, sugar sensing transcriptional regulator
MTQKIPRMLIVSLMDLGLSNYEAQTYTGLVFFGVSEVKDLFDFLGLARPCVYENLYKLEKKGLAVKINSKPVAYRPVPPEIAVKILTEHYTISADVALKELKKLGLRKSHKEGHDAVRIVVGDKNINLKIRSMIRNARHSIECVMGEHYLPFFEGISLEEIDLTLTVLSDDRRMINSLKMQFPGQNHVINALSLSKMIKAHIHPPYPGDTDAGNSVKFEIFLELIVDKQEFLSIPPISDIIVNGVYITNKAMILHVQEMREWVWGMMMEVDPDIQA